jgi:lysophospholipase L1-like esterase
MAQVQNERDIILESAIERVTNQRPSDIVITGRGVIVNGNTLSKPTTSSVGWDADAYSNQNSTASAFATASAAATNKDVVFGLNQDPATDKTKDSIDYGFHLHADGTFSIIEAGKEIAIAGTTTGNTGGGQTGGTTGGTTLVPTTLHYYGSSFVYGYDGAQGGGRVATPVPEYVQSRITPLTVVNMGVDSSSTSKALAGTNGVQPQWSTQMANTTCDWIIIEYGLNDSFDITPLQFRANLNQMYRDAVATGKKVIFQTVHFISPDIGDPEGSGHIQAMRDEAAALGIHCIDNWAYTKPLWQGDPYSHTPDGYHPNQASYLVIGEFTVNQVLTFMPNVISSSGAGQGGGNVQTGGGTGAAGGGTSNTSGYPQSGTIAYWGDEIIFGLDENYSRVATSPVVTFDNDLNNFTVSNEGVSDQTTTRVLNGTDTQHSDIVSWINAHPFTYMIFETGLWDHFIDGGIDVNTYGTNLSTIVDDVRAAGTIIIFETWNETDIEAQCAPFRQKMRDVAAAKKVPIIDQYTYLYNYRINNGIDLYTMYPNGQHPSQAVYDMKGHYAATAFKQIIGAA